MVLLVIILEMYGLNNLKCIEANNQTKKACIKIFGIAVHCVALINPE